MLQIIDRMKQSNDQEIADIYERVLKGDKAAISNMHKIGNSPLKKSQRLPQNVISKAPEQQQTSQDLSKASKSENFRKYLKQKVSELGSGNQPQPKKEITKNQKQGQKKQFAEPKPFSKVRKRSQIHSQKRTPQNLQQNKKNGPPIQKTKTTSHNFQQNIKRNIIKDTATEKDKQSTPPSSKHSFRIRTQGGNKKLLEELMRLNQEEKTLQYEILQFHKQNKDTIAAVCKKYGVNQLGIDKIKESAIEDDIPDSPSKGFLKNNKGKIGSQEAQINKLQREIASINAQVENKKTEIQKRQAKVEILPLYTYINAIPDIFEERQSEQEGEQIGELPQQQSNKMIDPIKTYQSVMTEMRKKKWGLNQRVNYESEGVKNVEQKQVQKSPGKAVQKQFSPMKMGNEEGTKIVVNPRLKQFLFE